MRVVQVVVVVAVLRAAVDVQQRRRQRVVVVVVVLRRALFQLHKQCHRTEMHGLKSVKVQAVEADLKEDLNNSAQQHSSRHDLFEGRLSDL